MFHEFPEQHSESISHHQPLASLCPPRYGRKLSEGGDCFPADKTTTRSGRAVGEMREMDCFPADKTTTRSGRAVVEMGEMDCFPADKAKRGVGEDCFPADKTTTRSGRAVVEMDCLGLEAVDANR